MSYFVFSLFPDKYCDCHTVGSKLNGRQEKLKEIQFCNKEDSQ